MAIRKFVGKQVLVDALVRILHRIRIEHLHARPAKRGVDVDDHAPFLVPLMHLVITNLQDGATFFGRLRYPHHHSGRHLGDRLRIDNRAVCVGVPERAHP